MSRHITRTAHERALHLASYYRVKAARTPEQQAEWNAKKYAYDVAYKARNRERMRRSKAEYYAARREAKKQESAETRKKMRNDPELRAKYNAAVRRRLEANNGAKAKEARLRGKEWRAKNADYIREKQRAYYKAHPEIYFAAVRKRRALKKAAAVNLKGIQRFIEQVRSKPFAHCYYCHARVPSMEVHLDHIVALSKGGAHAVENLCVACAPCNLSKGAKPLLEWARENATQQLLNL
jgi:Restriction endonuclease